MLREERARVAEELLSSLEEPDEEIATAWVSELERRSRDMAEGKAQAVEWSTAQSFAPPPFGTTSAIQDYRREFEAYLRCGILGHGLL